MDDFKDKRIGELVLYILNKGKVLTQYYIYKILYFAERKHLAKWGVGILPGEFHAWECGPVPKRLYGGIKNFKNGEWPIDKVLNKIISRADKDMGDYLIPLREPNMDYISDSEAEAIDEAYIENAHLDIMTLMRKSHDSAWHKARISGNDIVMTSHDIALAEGASDELSDYIEENEQLRMLIEN